MELTACNDIESLQQQHRQWLSDELAINRSLRDVSWTESLAVGNQIFVDEVQTLLGIKASKRNVAAVGENMFFGKVRRIIMSILMLKTTV